jgi:signal transduction histidine kinase
MAVVHAVQASMLTESSHRVWNQIVEQIPRHEATLIEIVNIDGEVLFSTDPGSQRTVHRLSDPSCAVCHGANAPRPIAETAFLRDPEDKRFQFFVAPLNNAEECLPCHSTEGPKLGMVLVRESLGPIHNRVRAAQTTLAGVGALTLLLTLLTTRLLLGRYLNRPLKQLVAGAGEIGSGNLQHRITLPERTELAVLADTLNTSTARLSELQRELVERERLAAVGETVAGLSHSLKNMLNGLIAGQCVLDLAVDEGDTEKLRTGLDVMKRSVQRIEELIFDMLHYVKDRVPRRELVDPNTLILETVDTLKEAAQSKGVEIRAELDDGIGKVALDRASIYRALIDLACNAVDACTESETGNRVILKSSSAPDGIVLVVEDNGVGMSEEVMSRLFKRFFSTKGGKGTGLGLLVVKKIAEEHGATLEVDSVPGKGSSFHIHLPRGAEADEGKVQEPPGEIGGNS